VSAGTAPPTAGMACPRCGAHVADGQDWCLQCGDAARTRLVPTPNWRAPIAVAAIVAALALIAIAVSFVSLTRDDAPVERPATPATTAAPPPAATTAAPTTTATIPTATTPTATTPTATTPTATAPTATGTTPGATTTPSGETSTTP
jgi:hypothetical protein